MLVLPEDGGELRQRVFERRFQGVGRVDQKHAACGQAGANRLALVVMQQLAGLDGERCFQPAFACAYCQGFELARQVVRLGARNQGIPHRISAGGKAHQRVGHHGLHAGVVVLDFVARVAKQERAARGRGQKLLHAFKAVFYRNRHLATCFQLRDVGRERFGVGRVQLKQLELVAPAQVLLNDEG